MKSKLVLFGLVISMLFSLNACKSSKQSAYKAAYDAAKEREMIDPTASSDMEEVTPVVKTPASTVTTPTVTQREKVTPIDYSGIKRFSVVVGSFTVKTNASSLKERMSGLGYNAFLAQNERQMYRVIIATFDDKSEAAELRDKIKTQYYPDQFQDSWILEQEY